AGCGREYVAARGRRPAPAGFSIPARRRRPAAGLAGPRRPGRACRAASGQGGRAPAPRGTNETAPALAKDRGPWLLSEEDDIRKQTNHGPQENSDRTGQTFTWAASPGMLSV